jgi:hypothetical protein
MAKTEELSGMEGEGVTPKKIKRLENAIEKWRGYVTQRMAVLESEVEARDNVIAIMHAENLTKYPYWIDDEVQKVLVLDSTEKLKLKKPEASEDADDGEGDDE